MRCQYALDEANNCEFLYIHRRILSRPYLFGVEIIPDWQEYKKTNMYY